MSRSLNVVCLFGVAAIFRSLLYEACGRILNPIDGLLGLLLSGNWAVCEAGVESILLGTFPAYTCADFSCDIVGTARQELQRSVKPIGRLKRLPMGFLQNPNTSSSIAYIPRWIITTKYFLEMMVETSSANHHVPKPKTKTTLHCNLKWLLEKHMQMRSESRYWEDREMPQTDTEERICFLLKHKPRKF